MTPACPGAAPGAVCGIPPAGASGSVRRRLILWALATTLLAFGLRLLEWPCWQDPEYRLGAEMLLATHDAYHWVAGAEGFSFGAGHPMSELLRILADLLRVPPATAAFWLPAVLSSLTALMVFFWAWAMGGAEAGFAAGVIASLSPGFLARTLLGYYDTDLVTLLLPLLMTLAPAVWATRHAEPPLAPILRRMRRAAAPAAEPEPLRPLSPAWAALLGLSGLLSWWAQEWHSVLPYLIRFDVLLLGFLCLFPMPGLRRRDLLLGAAAHALPALAGPAGLAAAILAAAAERRGRLRDARLILALWLGILVLAARGEIVGVMLAHVDAYLKRGVDVRAGAEAALGFPSVARSIVEVQDLDIPAVLSCFHPWRAAAALGLAGFAVMAVIRPGLLFLLPLAALGLLSVKMGGRMVMFGAPVTALGLTLPAAALLIRLGRRRGLPAPERWAGPTAAILLSALLAAPFADMPAVMSQGPMIDRRHADALARAREITPPDATLWLWWDWGYAAHHFARREVVADGARHAGPSLLLPAAVLAADSPRFARQIIRLTALRGGEPGDVFKGMGDAEAQLLLDRLRSPATPLVEARGRQFLVVSFETLRLGFWIGSFGSWDFTRRRGEGAAISIVNRGLSYSLSGGWVRLDGDAPPVPASSITVFDETGVTVRDYLQEWLDAHPRASAAERRRYLAGRRNLHFLFNRVTGEKIAMGQRLRGSLMVRLLTGDPRSPLIAPYFRLVYDNGFARIYEVL